MFTVVQQFSTMAANAIEAMQPMIEKFDDILEELKRKPYDLLDHTKTNFERDFLEFQAAIHHLESSLQVLKHSVAQYIATECDIFGNVT